MDCVISAAPFFPNSSVAICSASVSVFAFLIASICSRIAVSASLPSFVAFWTALDREVIAVDVSTPFDSIIDRRFTDSVISNPSSFKAAPLFSRELSSASMDIPDFCDALVRSPKTLTVWFESTPNFVMILSTFAMDASTSASLMLANFRKSLVMSSSAWPVRPNLVLISPTAAPTSPMSTGMDPNTFFAVSSSDESSSPVAPVFFAMVSRPLSTSLNAP